MRKVIILRGPSGSGKTTYHQNHYPKATICSADHYFTTNNEYHFDPKQLPQAHATCLTTYTKALARKDPLIVVDNTHTEEWEWINYYHIAKLAGYQVEIIEFQINTITNLRKIIARNTHQTPPEIITTQTIRFKPNTNRKIKTTKAPTTKHPKLTPATVPIATVPPSYFQQHQQLRKISRVSDTLQILHKCKQPS